MENKTLKTNIFSLDTVFCESAEQPIDIDFTLPDYYADISKILKCRAVSRISSKSINGDRIAVEGCVTVTVIYCGSDNCVSSYEYQYPFSKGFDAGINTQGCILNVKTKCEYVNCRAVTSRKIDIHGAVGIYATLMCRNTTNIISDCDDCNVETLRGSVPATIPMGCAEKYLNIEEEIELGAGQPEIKCIVRYDASATITDSKIMAGKSVVKGEMIIKLLYASDNATMQSVRYQLPFSQLIEIDGITDGCDCESKVSISQLEIKPRISAQGECRQLMLTSKLLISSECCCNNDVAVILDAYSKKYDATINKNEVCVDKIIDNINENFSCKKIIDLPEGTVCSVVDMWCEVGATTVKFDDNVMRVSGAVNAYIIANDCDGAPSFYEKELDYEFCYPINTDASLKASPQITVTGANYTLSDSSMEIRVELNICAAIYKCNKLKLITDIVIDGAKALQRNDRGAMTIYFASAGERIWDIAKRYIANVEDIKQINEIDDDVLCCDKMLLIPNS